MYFKTSSAKTCCNLVYMYLVGTCADMMCFAFQLFCTWWVRVWGGGVSHDLLCILVLCTW